MVFSKQSCILGSTSHAEEREFTFSSCASEDQDLQVVGSVCNPQDSPCAKELFLQFLNIPKATPPIFSLELCSVSQEPMAPWSSSKSFITSHSPRTAFGTLNGSPSPGLWSKQQGKLRNASPWKGVGIEGKHSFQEGQAQLRDHPSNFYSLLCCFTFPSAKKYICIGPRLIPDINPLTARVTPAINLAHQV